MNESNLLANLKFGPNPTVSEIRFSRLLAPYSTFQILDLNGRVLQAGAIQENQINLADMASGLYLLQVVENGHSYSFKVRKTE